MLNAAAAFALLSPLSSSFPPHSPFLLSCQPATSSLSSEGNQAVLFVFLPLPLASPLRTPYL